MGQISLAKNLRGDKGDWWGEAIKLILGRAVLGLGGVSFA